MHPYTAYMERTCNDLEYVMQAFGFQGMVKGGDAHGPTFDLVFHRTGPLPELSRVDLARWEFLLHHRLNIRKVESDEGQMTLTVLYRQ